MKISDKTVGVLFIVNVVVLVILMLAVSFLAYNQYRLDQKYNGRYEWTKGIIDVHAAHIDAAKFAATGVLPGSQASVAQPLPSVP